MVSTSDVDVNMMIMGNRHTSAYSQRGTLVELPTAKVILLGVSGLYFYILSSIICYRISGSLTEKG